MEVDIKTRIRATPPTLVRDAEVHDELDMPRGVREISLQLDVSTPDPGCDQPVVLTLGCG